MQSSFLISAYCPLFSSAHTPNQAPQIAFSGEGYYVVIITKLPANRMAETERKKVVEKG
jgi:hypothetical protein